MSLSQAMKEAYASADVSEVPLHTLELRHPAFVDDHGNPTAIRIVRGYENWNLTLELDAPMNPGQSVLFTACPFDFTLPEFAENQVPQLQIAVSNVSREITKYLEMAIASLAVIGVTYRPYLASDVTKPQMNPVISMNATQAQATAFQVTMTATLEDVFNWPFPNRKYLPREWAGLVR